MPEGTQIDITPNQDGGVLKVVRRKGPDPDDKPWKGDKVQVIILNIFTHKWTIVVLYNDTNKLYT